MAYNWQQAGWPNFQYGLEELQPLFLEFAIEWAELNGMQKAFPKDIEQETLLDIMVSEAVKSAAIEGEFYSREDVMSSIKNKLGISLSPLPVKDRYATGIAELMVLVRRDYAVPLSEEMLKNWHTCLFANARNLTIGDWRRGAEPMQVVSGALGQEKVHFEALPSWRVGPETKTFLDWFNGFKPLPDNPIASAMLKSAIAHLYFESIHPFEDGNGRIGRAISEKALTQGMNRPLLLSISKIIEADKNAYYQALKLGQSSLQIDTWLKYFLNVLINAQREARMTVAFLLRKVRFFDSHNSALEERHRKVLSKMFDAGPSGFVGGMSAKKYMSITHVSKATATRDLQYLVQQGVFTKEGDGRSVRYHLNLGQEG